MIESERIKLSNAEAEYVNIGITPGGVAYTMIGIPWEATIHAYYMRIPNIYLAPEDLRDEEIMKLLESRKVRGCYIWTPLDDYSFLARFKDLQDINIKKGDAIRDLDFLSGLYECRLLYLQNARLKNLDTVVEVKKNSTATCGCLVCVGLDNCEVEDLSVFEKEKVHFSEFLIWKPKGINEQERWKAISARTRRYFEFEEKG